MDDHLKTGNELEWEAFPRWAVARLDKIDKLYIANGRQQRIEGEQMWKVARMLFNLFKHGYPQEYKQHMKELKQLKSAAYNEHASTPRGKQERRSVGSSESAQIRHIISMPGRYHQMLMKYFPKQETSREFLRELARRIPELRVPDKI